MTRTEKNQILNILHYYRGLLGVDKRNTKRLIVALKQVETFEIKPVDADPIFWAVQKHTGITKKEILSQDRLRGVADARLITFAHMKETGAHDTKIAESLNRNRSTIIAYRSIHSDLMQSNKAYKALHDKVSDELHAND